MADCTVTCRTCRTEKDLPMVWHWLCEECAQECVDRHRRETGHHTELQVTESTTEQLRNSCQVAAMIRHRERFW